jgi:hypothetical protein
MRGRFFGPVLAVGFLTPRDVFEAISWISIVASELSWWRAKDVALLWTDPTPKLAIKTTTTKVSFLDIVLPPTFALA